LRTSRRTKREPLGAGRLQDEGDDNNERHETARHDVVADVVDRQTAKMKRERRQRIAFDRRHRCTGTFK